MTPSLALRQPVETAPAPRTRPLRMIACLVFSDSAALLLAVAISLAAKFATEPDVYLFAYARLFPFLPVFLVVYASIGLYSGISLGSPEELRRVTISSGLLFLTLAAITVTFRGASSAVNVRLIVAWMIATLLVPLFRAATRRWLGTRAWWGYPAVVFGAGEAAARVVASLRKDPGLGLRPVAILDDEVSAEGRALAGDDHPLPVVNGDRLLDGVLNAYRDAYAVVVMSGAPHGEIARQIDEYGPLFSHVLLLPDVPGFSTKWTGAKQVAGMWSIEVRRQGLRPRDQYAKRLLDIVLCLLTAPVVLPLMALLVAAVRINSPGPVFYGQRRIGRGGREFTAWKFRTMVIDSDEALGRHLAANAAARREWDEFHKLKDDPRVTAAGALLRKSSLDELPQLWNVVKGEMSLVGPRPIVRAEVARYGSAFERYRQIPGGITGLWQVSGRNDTTYHERVLLDDYYARNWSVWLDLCILFQTLEAVVLRRGAY